MFLGTPRWWWIMTAVIFVLGLAFIGSELGGAFGTPVGVLLVLLAIILFAASPRPRREEPPAPVESEAPVRAAAPEAPAAPPRPRPTIEGRDASEV